MGKRKRKVRNRLQIAHDSKEAAQMRLNDMSFREIGAIQGRSFQQVHIDLTKVTQELMEDAKGSMAELREQTRAKLQVAQVESYLAWQESRNPKQKLTRKSGGKDGPEESETIELQSGNPGHMSNYIKAVKDEAELLGLYKDAKESAGGEIVQALTEAVKMSSVMLSKQKKSSNDNG